MSGLSEGELRDLLDVDCDCGHGPDDHGSELFGCHLCPDYDEPRECPRSFLSLLAERLNGWADAREAAWRGEVDGLRRQHRDLTSRLGFGDGVTEPMADNDTIVKWFNERGMEADEWRESQRWRDECYAAGHSDDEDCWEHDPRLRLEKAEREVDGLRARVEAVLPDASKMRAEHHAMEDRGEDCGCAYKDCYECGKWHNCTHGVLGLAADVREALDADSEPSEAPRSDVGASGRVVVTLKHSEDCEWAQSNEPCTCGADEWWLSNEPEDAPGLRAMVEQARTQRTEPLTRADEVALAREADEERGHHLPREVRSARFRERDSYAWPTNEEQR